MFFMFFSNFMNVYWIFFIFAFGGVSLLGHTSKSDANRKDILQISKKVCISLQRGDIDVRPSHAKLLFFKFCQMSLPFYIVFYTLCRCITRFTYFWHSFVHGN